MWWRRPLILWIAFCSGCIPGVAESFTIRPTGAAGGLEIRYFLRGAFGGYGAYIHDPDKDGAFPIPLEIEGKPVVGLKAILYAPGCQFAVLSVDLLSDLTRNATFECRQLSTIALRGVVSPPPAGAGAWDVEILYVASWDHKFFGIGDGFVQTFTLGKALLNAAGRFEIRIPDFSKDGVTSQTQDAYLEVLVVEHSTGKVVEHVYPSDALPYGRMDLKVSPEYGPEIWFSPRR
ncbi:MAG TPA: hypothetical protein VGZ73_10010 [Bryobacteraceae bacterium]|jgi:hypothetical protein|nr:hypothetical protein [Bryobacteraceae bacterium]